MYSTRLKKRTIDGEKKRRKEFPKLGNKTFVPKIVFYQVKRRAELKKRIRKDANIRKYNFCAKN